MSEIIQCPSIKTDDIERLSDKNQDILKASINDYLLTRLNRRLKKIAAAKAQIESEENYDDYSNKNS